MNIVCTLERHSLARKIYRKEKVNKQNQISSFTHSIASFCVNFFRVLDSKLTIMVVPHSGKKIVNFQTNVCALIFSAVIFVGVLASFFYFNSKSISRSAEISRLMSENRETLARFDVMRDETLNLVQAASRVGNSLSQTFTLLGIEKSANVPGASNGSDLALFFNVQDNVNGVMRENADIKEATDYLHGAIQPIEQIGKMLENQNNLFKEIPSIWPTTNLNAHMSWQFGPAIHPLTGQWYVHKGLDFSTYRSGDPVIATADGQVVSAGYDASFGNNVIIRHKHGIYTRYAHLSRITVTRGQNVEQRTLIGYIGNTGITTGPHLHYEVHIGSDVVDPAKYVNIKFAN